MWHIRKKYQTCNDKGCMGYNRKSSGVKDGNIQDETDAMRKSIHYHKTEVGQKHYTRTHQYSHALEKIYNLKCTALYNMQRIYMNLPNSKTKKAKYIPPVMTETSVVTDLLQTLKILTKLVAQSVAHNLRELSVLNILLSVKKPVWDLELAGVAHDSDELLNLQQKNNAMYS